MAGGSVVIGLRSNLEVASRLRIKGWLQDLATPSDGVALEIVVNGNVITRLVANTYRADLEQAGIGNGRHGFVFDIPPGSLSPLTHHVVQVRLERDGSDMPGSPVVIEPMHNFDISLEQAVSDAVSTLDGGELEERALTFMMAQAERLQQRKADNDGQRAERAAFVALRRRWGPKTSVIAEAKGFVDPGLRALVLDRFMPVAGRDAGSEAILSHMRALRRLGYNVSFAAVDDMLLTGKAAKTGDVTWCGAPVYGSVEEVLRRQADAFDLVYIHRVDVASRYMELVRHYAPRAHVIFSVADLHHVRLAGQAQVEDRPDLQVRAHRVRAAEWHAAYGADGVITHSEHEAELLRAAVPGARVHVVPWDVPVRSTSVPFAERHGLAFVGCFGHEPNVDAAHHLVEDVMPLVWRRDASIRCLLVGPGVPPSVQSLSSDKVIVTGQVEDLGDVWDQVRLTVAPLRYGAGLKGKVLSSFAAGLPCAMSQIAAEGLALPLLLRKITSNDRVGLADAICRLHTEENLSHKAGAAGQVLIRENFSNVMVDAGMRVVINSAMSVTSRAITKSSNGARRQPAWWRTLLGLP